MSPSLLFSFDKKRKNGGSFQNFVVHKGHVVNARSSSALALIGGRLLAERRAQFVGENTLAQIKLLELIETLEIENRQLDELKLYPDQTQGGCLINV